VLFRSATDLIGWIVSEGGYAALQDSERNLPRRGIWIETLEGEIGASPLDFIIQGVQGEFYPCKPDIFEMTYESVEGEEKPWWAEENERLATPQEMSLLDDA
jgi:hypothetical protein